MPNKTIPELDEIDLGDVEDTNLFAIDNGITTFKFRLSTLMDFLLASQRRSIEVVFDGITTGIKTVDVTAAGVDATSLIWILKKPLAATTYGEQMYLPIKATDTVTVTIDTGDFALDAGTYVLRGV